MIGIDTLGNPVCEPLCSLEDVLSWNAVSYRCYERPVSWNNQTFEHNKDNHGCGKRPQILVCHDMKGGYLDDRFTQGTDNVTAYRFYHWHLIDTFIYFSHSFITVPPVGWICAAHRNGVQILGTVITESDGICQELLASKETIETVAAKLAEIAFVCGFDGWFINIENVVEEKSISDLQYFVQQLRQQCCNCLNDAVVLWYDSVTHDGKLDWQNELNDKNEMFFSACDGIFLNYAITDEKLAQSRERAQTVNRCFDVYVGVDVFGRATPGGGGFNCREVLEMISKYKLSCAIFAQGWVYEKHGAEDFDANEMEFWRLLKDFLPLRSVEVPFSTSFCQGFGQKHYLEGKVVSEKPWHNLCLQQIQPSYMKSAGASLTTTDAYNGGGCLKISSADVDKGLSLIRLFKVSVHKGKPLTMSAVWKGCETCSLAFLLTPDEESGVLSDKKIVLAHDTFNPGDDDVWKQCLHQEGCHTNPLTECLQFVKCVHSEGRNSFDWKTSQWDIDTDQLFKDGGDCQHLTLSAVLVSLKKESIRPASNDATNFPGSPLDKTVLLGNLQVRWKYPLQSSLIQPVISHVTYLEVKTTEPLTTLDISAVDSKTRELREATKSDDVLTAFPKLSPIEDSSSVHEIAPAHADNLSPLCLNCLNWTISNDCGVDYCVLYCLDEKGVEYFIGCTATKSFVHMCNASSSLNVMAYSIQPVMKSTSLLGQKFTFLTS